jgi:hypothetical protein
MRKLLRDLAPGQQYGVRFQAVRTDGSVSDWSQIYRFITNADPVAPGPPTGLTWATKGSSFVGSWTRPTVDQNGFPLKDFKNYKIIISQGGTSKVYNQTTETFEFTMGMNTELFGADTPGYSLTISVQARDQTDNLSTAATATATEGNPPIPSTPIVSVLMSEITVKWDGNPATGVRNAFSVNHVEVHASTSSGFTPSESTMRGRFDGVWPGTQSTVLSGFAYGTPVYVKLVSVNRYGVKSTPSAQATATPERITGLDIQDGQISTSEINFTAYDIGGANAYYPASNAARDAIVGAKANDIAYVTGTGYTTYRYNGTSWVAATEIGVVQGSKILAGTVTANAIGTNLIITTSANIGTAVIDSANISSINAAKITTGTLQSSLTVTYGGSTPRPAWSVSLTGLAEFSDANIRGQLVIGNSGDPSPVRAASLLRSYDYLANTAGWAIKGDGSAEFNSATIRGTIVGATITGGSITGASIQTAATGRRITIGSGGALGEISFYAPDGDRGFIRSYTEADNSTESFQFGVFITGTNTLWNRITINSNAYIITRADVLEHVYGDRFTVYKGDVGTGSNGELRFSVDATGIYNKYYSTGSYSIWEENASSHVEALRFQIEASGQTDFYMSPGFNWNIIERAPGGADLFTRFAMASNEARFQFSNNDAWATMSESPSSDRSPLFKLIHPAGYGSAIFHRSNSTDGSTPRVEFTNHALSGYHPLWASAFTVSSTEAGKTDVRKLGSGNLEKMEKMELVHFRRKTGSKEAKRPVELGTMAERAPEEIKVYDENGNLFGVDSTAWNAMNTASIQELAQLLREAKAEIETLKTTVTELKGKK